jgi:hypothetical protein
MNLKGKQTVLGSLAVLIMGGAMAGWVQTELPAWVWLVSSVVLLVGLVGFADGVWYTEEEREEVRRRQANPNWREEDEEKDRLKRECEKLRGMSTNELSTELVRLWEEAAGWGRSHGHPIHAKYPQYRQVRAIGQMLHELGGFKLMQEVYKQAARQSEGYSEHWWHGIGDWQG